MTAKQRLAMAAKVYFEIPRKNGRLPAEPLV